MKSDVVSRLHKNFEEFVQHEGEVEFWYARDLQSLLGYSEWRNFEAILNKAKIACESSKGEISHHFVDVNKMIPLGKGAEREVKDMKLTRYACYLTAQNGDSRKEEIAFAQCYFAVQTRKQEVIEGRIRDLERLNAREKLTESESAFSRIMFERGVDSAGIRTIRSKGDRALFGGFSTKQMKQRMNVPESKPLADHLPTVLIAAKDLATEMTNYNVEEKDLSGEVPITSEHVANNSGVRKLLLERDIVPENARAEEDVKKLERRVKSDEKRISTKAKGFGDDEI